MNSVEEYKNNLLKFDLQSFLKDYYKATSIQLKKLFPEIYKLLIAQLALYPKAIKKLPEFTAHFCYMTTKSYEQSSSEAMANYKASLFKGNTVIDLSGGLGIDDIALSRSFKNVISVDMDSELNLLADVNFAKLKINNIERITSKAEEYIKQESKAELIFIDADRRTNISSKKSVTLHDSSPDILSMISKLFELSPLVLLKLSPLVDITYLKKSLPNVKWLRVVSLNNEVKEILVLLDKVCKESAKIFAVDISTAGNIKQFPDSIENIKYINKSTVKKYFYEPAPCLIKASLINKYAEFTGLTMLADNCIYFVSEKLPADFLGRAFLIIDEMLFGKSALRKYLADKNINKANISCRNFPVKPDDIKKTFKLNDGGDDYLFFTTGSKGDKLFYHCRKIEK